MKILPALISALLFPLLTFAGIFGEDDREFVTKNSAPKIQELAKSVAVEVSFGRIKNFTELNAPTYFGISGTYQTEWNTCDGTRFNEQSSLPTCTAFLVAPDVILTAAHCGLLNQAGCDSSAWVFDYTIDSSSVKTTVNSDPILPFEIAIDGSKLYRCKKILSFRYDPNVSGADYSLIQLDRPAVDRTPLKIKTDGSYSGKENLFSIGAMGGTFLVYTKPTPVYKVETKKLYGPFDLIAKGSGGPYFDAESGLVVGIAVESSHDFYYKDLITPNPSGVNETCQRTFVLDPPYTDKIKLSDGSFKSYPYTEAERIDFLPEVLRILGLRP